MSARKNVVKTAEQAVDERAKARKEIVSALALLGGNGCVVDTNTELRRELGMTWCSKTSFKRALGSLVKSGVVLRLRGCGEGASDTHRPTMYCLKALRSSLPYEIVGDEMPTQGVSFSPYAV